MFLPFPFDKIKATSKVEMKRGDFSVREINKMDDGTTMIKAFKKVKVNKPMGNHQRKLKLENLKLNKVKQVHEVLNISKNVYNMTSRLWVK